MWRSSNITFKQKWKSRGIKLWNTEGGTGRHGNIGGSAEEEEEFVVTDVVDSSVDVGEEKVGGWIWRDWRWRIESSMRLRLGYASVDGR